MSHVIVSMVRLMLESSSCIKPILTVTEAPSL